MFVFTELKQIYIIVPGTGSNSFWPGVQGQYPKTNQLKVAKTINGQYNYIHKMYDGRITMYQHWTAEQVKKFVTEEYGLDFWNDHEKIAFVRHPYTWARSMYRKSSIDRVFGMNNHVSASEWVTKNLDLTPYFWFTDDKDNVIIDKIYRTEDLKQIAEEYKIPYMHQNKSKTTKEFKLTDEDKAYMKKKFWREFQHYTDEETKEIEEREGI